MLQREQKSKHGTGGQTMRLIDADNIEFRCQYEGECIADKESCKICDDYVYNFREVQSLQTAYDVDKVVEQLKELNKYNLNLADCILDIQSHGLNRHFICLEDAIEIVKVGGIDEQ